MDQSKPADKKATFNLNNTRSAKYWYSAEAVEEKEVDSETRKYFQEVYDFHHLIKAWHESW